MKAAIQDFAALVAPEIQDENLDLFSAALALARPEYPSLDVSHYVDRIEALAKRVRQRIGTTGDTSDAFSAMNRVLFEEENFRGNRLNYYDPRNSYLNEVLDRGLGIPITLSVVYMEVARRVGIPVFGVGMPGHFLLKHYGVSGHETFIDPYSGGNLLSPYACQARLAEVYGLEVPMQQEFLTTVRKRQILSRMLNNLRSIYISNRSFRKALTVVDCILAIEPRSADDLRQRALLRYNEGMFRAAAEDLDEYVRIAPDASDADEMKETALSIRRSIAMMN